ncbi:hypothetical protein COO60DRAFT_937779 [Scenedesmus sp. NREL 46B-D3]|nr:hypothetical protein COO60DRAFT_937779 [Scenedesmus sp. NREL 46B-D3]
MDIRLLPGVALTAVGQRLEEPDAASCRLASRQLATVAPQQQQQTGSCLQVSASSFQAQLRAEKQQEPATRRDKEGVPTADAAAATGARAERAARRQALAAPAAEHHHEGDGTQQASTANQQQQQHQSNGAVLPRFSKTAGSVVRAAALLGCSCVRLHVDVLQAYADVTWQQLFSALAACPGITSVRVIEYASLQDRKDFEFWQPATPAMQELTQRVLDTGSGCLDTTTAAGRRYKHCNWLLELAARLSKQLQELDLQLQAPLPPAQQRLLLQLQALRTLKHGPADDMLMPDEILVVLLPQVVVQLSALQQLRSLTIVMGPAEDKEQDIQVALKLQQTFGTLGSRLTHLSFGLADAKTKLQLSAPLNRMPELQTLICRSGFTLDAEDLLYPELDPAGSDQGFDSSSDSAAAAAAAAAQVVPSLTRLVLNSGWDHGPLLQLLTQPSREGLAAAASRTLLQQLELNCHRELPFELMNQLEGLRSLKFMAQEKHDLADFIARAPALVKQLQGLTAMLTQPSSQYDEWAAPYRPVSLLAALTGLTSLKVIGTPYVLLSTSQDLPLLASTMPQLQGLTFVGGLTQQRTAALPMQPPPLRLAQVGSHRSSSISSFIVLETPPRLTGLALFCMEPDSKERQTLRFMHGALPSSLKSLCITGVTSSMQGPYGDTAGNAAGWQDVQDSSSSGRHQAEGAGEGAAAADNAAGSGGSSKAGRPAAAPSAGGDVLAALPLLENADVTMESLEDAAVMLRWARGHVQHFAAEGAVGWPEKQHMRRCSLADTFGECFSTSS